jgi:hypothetical protein
MANEKQHWVRLTLKILLLTQLLEVSAILLCPFGKPLTSSAESKIQEPHCRFLFPKKPCQFGVDAKTGDITLERNHPWVNKRNKILSCAFRSNHDISFIASTSRMLASLYYMSNYATKDDVKVHQLVMTAAILKASLEKAAAEEGNLTPEQQRLLDMRPADYPMKVYNQFRKEREVGAVMISSYLIGNPAFYMPNEKYRNLNLFWVKRAVRGYAAQSRPLLQASTAESDFEEDETYAKFHPVEQPTPSYIDYVHRGPRVSQFCLYEYMSQIGTVRLNKAPSDSFPFEPEHPKVSTHRQHSVHLREGHGEDESDGLWIPAIYGTLTDVNNKGKAASQILDDSQNVKNDIAEAMLGLFIPWEQLQDLFERFGSDVEKFPEPRDACGFIWSKIQPELPLYLQRLAENFSYLRRSKEDADKDRKARQIEIADWEERALEYVEDQQFEYQRDEENLIPEFLSRLDLQHDFMDTLNLWDKKGAGIGQLEPNSSQIAGTPSIEFSTRALLPVKLAAKRP